MNKLLRVGGMLAMISTFSADAMAVQTVDCENPQTTLAVNHCLFNQVKQAEARLEGYLGKGIERYEDDEAVIEAIKKGQETWLAYRREHCASVYETWRDGSIRASMALECQLTLTNQRTWVIWSSYLTFADSTAPLLPEPGVTDE